MASKDSLEKSIRYSLLKRYQPCPELQKFLANNRNKLKVPVMSEMLEAIPWECQRYFVGRYEDEIPKVEKSLFDEIAADWFTDRLPKPVLGRYELIYDLKSLLKDWGFHDFYEKNKDKLAVNMNDELFSQLNIYFCLDEVLESQINRIQARPAKKSAGRIGTGSDHSEDPKISMIAAAQKTFFFASMLNLQLKWMLDIMELAYLDGSMKASLDSEEYENFSKMQQAVHFPSVDECVDIMELFPPQASVESTAALRLLLKNVENEIMQKVGKEKQKILKGR